MYSEVWGIKTRGVALLPPALGMQLKGFYEGCRILFLQFTLGRAPFPSQFAKHTCSYLNPNHGPSSSSFLKSSLFSPLVNQNRHISLSWGSIPPSEVRPLALLLLSQRELRYSGKNMESLLYVCASTQNPGEASYLFPPRPLSTHLHPVLYTR